MMKIAFVGSGKHAQSAHIPNYARLKDVEVAAIVDLDQKVGRKVADIYNTKYFQSHTQMLQEVKPDGVVVTLSSMAAADIVIPAVLEAGIPCISEKPMAYSLDSGRRLVEKAAATGTPFYVGYHKRSDPASRYAREQIEQFQQSGELGQMTYVKVFVSLRGNWIAGAYDNPVSAASAPGSAPYCPKLSAEEEVQRQNLGFKGMSGARSHQLDLMRFLLGEPYQIKCHEETGVLLQITSESGVPGIHECTPFASSQEWLEEATVAFERGYVKIKLPPPLAVNRAGEVEIFKDFKDGVPQRIRPVMPFVSAMHSQAREFCNAIRIGTSTVLCDAGQGLEAIEISHGWGARLRAVELEKLNSKFRVGR